MKAPEKVSKLIADRYEARSKVKDLDDKLKALMIVSIVQNESQVSLAIKGHSHSHFALALWVF